MKKTLPKIGFIGQGWIGKNYADDFEGRGYPVVRYGIEKEYAGNKKKISTCDIVFIAVPTPTTVKGFDVSIVRSVLSLVGKGKTAIIKSTMQPGMTDALQASFPDTFVFHSPEFLREAHAAYDAAHPDRNIIGMPMIPKSKQKGQRTAAEAALAVLPSAPFSKIVSAKEAELVKYAGNGFLTQKVLFFNVMYDLAAELGVSYDSFRECVIADPRIGASHTNVVHASGHAEDKPGRGAGGHCFIKDWAALRELYQRLYPADAAGITALSALEAKNLDLLRRSGKDQDLVRGIYGE